MESSSQRVSRKRRHVVTFWLCAAFLSLGIIVAMLGPTLLDLGHQIGLTHNVQAQMARVFTARSLGYLSGSVLGGYLMDRIKNPCFLICVSMTATAVGTGLIPLCRSLISIAALTSTQGLAMGMLDTGGNVLLLQLWGAACGPYMQTLHFSFGIGAFFAPLLARQFIGSSLPTAQTHCGLEENPTTITTTASVWTTASTLFNLSTTTTTATATTTTTLSDMLSTATAAVPADDFEASRVQYAFIISSSLMSIVAVAFAVLSRSVPKEGEESSRNADDKALAHRREGTYRNVVLGLAFVFLFVYVGLEVSYGAYIFSYGVKYCPIQMNESTAAYLTSVYWGCFALFRLVAVPLSLLLSPAAMTIADLALCVASAFVLMLADHSVTVLWVGTAVFGASMASIFPSAYHLVEHYVDVTGFAASLIVVGAALGEMALPLLVGELFDSQYGPRSLMVVNFIGCAFAALIFCALVLWGRRHGTSYSRLHNDESFEMKPFAWEEDDDDEDEEVIFSNVRTPL
eukprot:m.250248 g.250248  ORF g.250248 m.250248 type:complete len:515 (-) comp22637_c0_seq1:46-1590(-)